MENTKFSGLTIIVPTRNRSQNAVKAILSILHSQHIDSIRVLVSDNSTENKQSKTLCEFCQKLGKNDERIQYIKPPRFMSMPSHWEWAMDKALSQFDTSHFTILTDRMIFKKNQLEVLVNLSTKYPKSIISYNVDRVNDSETPVRLKQKKWSGGVIKIESIRLLYLVSLLYFEPSLPKMLNSVVSRNFLKRLKDSYGNVFDSVAPDYSFCFKALVNTDSIIYYDKSLLTEYAISRSNGASFSRGSHTKDSKDFLKNLPGDFSLQHTPVPELITPVNAIIYEYNKTKNHCQSDKLPEVCLRRYFYVIGQEANRIIDYNLRKKTYRMISLKRKRYLKSNKFVDQYKIFNTKVKIHGLNFLYKKWFGKFYGGFLNKIFKEIYFVSSDDALIYNDLHPIKKTNSIKHLRHLY
jgi:hypothetical protein